MRIPGTLNRKDERNGRQPVSCTPVECDTSRRYPFADFKRFAAEPPDRRRREQIAKVPLPTPRKLSPGGRDKPAELVLVSDTVPVGDRSEAGFHLCCWAIEHGVPQADVWAAVQGIGRFAERGERYFHTTWRKAEGHTRGKILGRVEAKAAKRKRRQTTAAEPPQAVQ